MSKSNKHPAPARCFFYASRKQVASRLQLKQTS
uniref:TEA/ATTS domain n=1 Tax=Myoviridae sp. ct25F5 TaxID=2826604 RepID=A0A8S5LTN8_9CAUD|nr:MAG TPA: TEA/ATTS domain [Myoviridae sp. ct25F5]